MSQDVIRCSWCGTDPLYVRYHDEEWGVPVHDERLMFEFLCLESFQAGLSWITILRKRENFRLAFDNFIPEHVAAYGEEKVEELLGNAGIIRNRQKIVAAIKNAQAFLKIQAREGSFCDYFWSFSGGKVLKNHWETTAQLPAKTELSDRIAKAFKKEGFSFLGSTTVYAHMQACGMVNDHEVGCFRREKLGGGRR